MHLRCASARGAARVMGRVAPEPRRGNVVATLPTVSAHEDMHPPCRQRARHSHPEGVARPDDADALRRRAVGLALKGSMHRTDMPLKLAAVVACSVLSLTSRGASAQLGADAALRIVAGCAPHARAKNQSHAIAVVDDGAQPGAPLRMRGTEPGTG